MCEKCPHDRGIDAFKKTHQIRIFSRVRTGPEKHYFDLASYSCKHRVTKNKICAVPCNGIDDLCEYNLDEQCQGPGLVMTLVTVCLLSISFLIVHNSMC